MSRLVRPPQLELDPIFRSRDIPAWLYIASLAVLGVMAALYLQPGNTTWLESLLRAVIASVAVVTLHLVAVRTTNFTRMRYGVILPVTVLRGMLLANVIATYTAIMF